MKTIIGGNILFTAKSINNIFNKNDKSNSEFMRDIKNIKTEFEKCCSVNKYLKGVEDCLKKIIPPSKETLCKAYRKSYINILEAEKTKGLKQYTKWSQQMDMSRAAKEKNKLLRDMKLRDDLDKITEGGNKIKRKN